MDKDDSKTDKFVTTIDASSSNLFKPTFFSDSDSDTSESESDDDSIINLTNLFTSLCVNEDIPTHTIMPFQSDFAFKIIPEFDGTRENFQKFLSCCDVVNKTATTESDKKVLLQIIESRISGKVFNLIKYHPYASWEELKVVLQNQFLERRTIAQLQAELISCRQYPNENVRSYANRLETLQTDLNEACIQSEGIDSSACIISLNAKTALKAFQDGLLESLRLIIRACRHTKLTDAIESAVLEERSQRTHSYNFSRKNKYQGSEIVCFKCKKKGHMANKCFSSTEPMKQSSKSNTDFSSGKSENKEVKFITCAYCKNKGHHIKDCRKRIHNEKQKSGNLNAPGTSGSVPGNQIKKTA